MSEVNLSIAGVLYMPNAMEQADGYLGSPTSYTEPTAVWFCVVILLPLFLITSYQLGSLHSLDWLIQSYSSVLQL